VKREKSFFKLSMLNEQEYKQRQVQSSGEHKEKDRVKTLRLLFSLRPGVFEAEDIEKNKLFVHKIRCSIGIAALGFVGLTVGRYQFIKRGRQDINKQFAMILLFYLPSMVYYSHWNRKYDEFLGDVSERYKDRITKKEIREFWE